MFEPPETFNIADHFLGERIAEGRGERIAVRLADRELSYDDVHRLADRYGHALRALGVRQEQRVVIALPDGADFVAALFGILRIGAVVVMVNPAQPRDRLAAVLEASRAPVVLLDHGGLPAFEGATRAIHRSAPHLLVVDGADGDRPQLALDEVAPPGAADAPLETAPTHRDDPAIWLFSGGTTGAPKAVVQTHRSFANTTECYAKRAVGYREDDTTVSVPKLYFGYATGSNLLFPFSVGASCALFAEHPDPATLFEAIARHRPTILVNVPSMVAKMLDHPDAAEQDLSSLRFATSAGEALPPALHRRWRETFGVELLDGLGTAEMWHIFVSNVPGDVVPGTLGRPVPGFDVEVRDEEGTPVPAGEVGRLWVRGGSRALGYWQDLPASMAAFRGEWFVGGDLVRQDEDGRVTYVGRGDDALKVKGKWLVPAEVEGVLTSHPAVSEAAVVGVADPDGLLRPVAFVVVDDSTPASDGAGDVAEELQRWVLDRLEPYKHPRRVHLVASLPRTHLGKVNRTELRRRAREEG